MPAGDSKIVDEATAATMIMAFDTTQDECHRIQSLVDGAHSALMSQWGGIAASAYSNSMTEWKEGFNRVRTALDMLNTSMIDYTRITAATEDDNVVRGSGWATGF